MALYWELAVCVISLLAILGISVGVAKGKLPKNHLAVKYLKKAFFVLVDVSVVSIFFTV